MMMRVLLSIDQIIQHAGDVDDENDEDANDNTPLRIIHLSPETVCKMRFVYAEGSNRKKIIMISIFFSSSFRSLIQRDYYLIILNTCAWLSLYWQLLPREFSCLSIRAEHRFSSLKKKISAREIFEYDIDTCLFVVVKQELLPSDIHGEMYKKRKK